MKKIIIYFDSMAPAGGVERVISNLANKWCNEYEVHLLTKDDEKSFYYLDSRVIRETLKSPLKFDIHHRIKSLFYLIYNFFSCHKSLKKYFKNNTFDYIYTASPMCTLDVHVFGKKYRKKLVVSEHASKDAPNALFQMVKKITYPKAYKISVPTTMDTSAYCAEGCDAIYIPHMATFQAERKSDLSNKVVLNVGRFTADKQQLLLIEIWNQINIKHGLNGWKLHLVGKGEEEVNLIKMIEEYSLQNDVKIIPPTNHIDELYEHSSIFAFTSRMEGFGMVLLEAMAFGVPCVSFNCPSGPRDIINDGNNGFLVECFDSNEYEDKLYTLMNKQSLLAQMGDTAYCTVKNWSAEKILDQWRIIFK